MADASGENTPLVTGGSSSIPRSRGALIASRRWITVEPIVVAISLGYGILMVVQSQYIHQYYTEKYAGTDSLANYSQCKPNISEEEAEISKKIQATTTMWNIAVTVCTSIGGIPVGFALGAYSDQIGRKIPLVISVIGMFLCSMFNFVTIHFQLPLYFLLFGMCVLGLTGNFMLVVTLCMSYVADVTSEKKRMLRIITLDVLLFLAVGVPQLGIGFLIKTMGYAFPFLIVMVVSFLVILYLLVPGGLHETVERHLDRSHSPMKTIFRDAVRILKVKENHRHIRIKLYMLVGFGMMGFGTGTFAVTVLYGMGPPLCLSPEKVGFFLFAALMSTGVGSMIGGAILPFCLSTFGIMYVSFLSNQVCFIATALATNELYLLLATSLGAFKLLALPIVRTELSKMVSADEQGTLFAMIGITGSVSELVFPVSFQTIYASSLSFNSQFVFYLCAGLVFVPWGIMIILHLMSRHLPSSPQHSDTSTSQEKVHLNSEQAQVML